MQRVISDDLSMVNNDNPVAKTLRFFHIVRGVEQRLAALLESSRLSKMALRLWGGLSVSAKDKVGTVQRWA